MELVFTFENPETCERRSTIAGNETIARMRLGGIWDEPQRTTACPHCAVDTLPAMIKRALEEEAAAHEAMVAANPIGKSKFTTQEALAEFMALKGKHGNLQFHRRELEKLAGRRPISQ